MLPSPYWGAEPIWDSQTSMHNPMFDEKGRVWFTSRVRPPANPAFCKQGSDHPSAKLSPIESGQPASVHVRSEDREDHADQHVLPDPPPGLRGGRQQHAVDERGRPAVSGVIGWLNRKMFEETGDEVKSQGWTATRARHQRQRQARRLRRARPAVDPPDKRIMAAFYGIAREPGATAPCGARCWASRAMSSVSIRDRILRRPRWRRSSSLRCRATGRAAWTSTATASVWTPLSSGHLASFDRSRCKGPLNGPSATGRTAPRAGRSIRSPGRSCRT